MRAADYVWTEPDQPGSIHLSLDVVRRLGIESMEAYKSLPHRGLEIGGLLLGRREGEALYIDNFEPVASEYRTGPSYVLSETDREAFEQALGRHPNAVGMYRTQTRLDSLALQVDDVELFQRYFHDPASVYLLVQPASGQAAFFVPTIDSLALGHEFPFRAGELVPQAVREEQTAIPVAQAPEETSPVAVPVAVPVAAGTPFPAALPPRKTSPKWLIPVAAIGLGMATGAVVYGVLHEARPARKLAAVPAMPVAEKVSSDHVSLNVRRDGPSIQLLWDRNAPLVREASKGILYISDGGHDSQLKLDPRELGSGLVSYWPDSKDVTFRLEVFGAGRNSDDTIRVVGGEQVSQSPAPPAAGRAPAVASNRQQQPTPARAAAPAVESHPLGSVVPPNPVPAGAGSSQGSASRSEIRPEKEVRPEKEPETPRPSPFTPLTKPAAAPKETAAAAAAPAATAANHEPQVWVKVETVGESRGIIGRIPLLRRLKKQPQTFVPPTAIREVRPSLTAREKRALVGLVPVDVKVYVGNSGKVQFAELLSNGERHEDLAASAVYAARHWEFTPARLGPDKVPGEVILHFRFAPEEPQQAAR
jgi:hypothetical protein